MHSSNMRILIAKVKISRLTTVLGVKILELGAMIRISVAKTTIKIASMLAIIINKEVVKIETSFLAL